MLRQIVGCTFVVFILGANVEVRAQAPTITHTVPYAVVPGKTVDVRFFGDDLHKADGLWSNLSGLSAEVVRQVVAKPADPKAPPAKPDPKRADFKVTLPADAVPGIYGVRVRSSLGASNLRLLMVDDLPTVAEAGNNKTPATAQAIAPPTAIDGATDAESSDFYKFTAKPGDRLSVEAVARRFGSPLDPVVRLLDAAGRELAFADDDETSGVDGRFTHRFQSGGEYFLEIRDVRYSGNANYRYRLRVGDFPLLTASYPMGVRQDTKSLVQPVGVDVGSLPPTVVTAGAVVGGRLPIAARYASGQGSGLATVTVGKVAEQTEFEPNDKPEQASPLAAVGGVNGRFEQANDRDYFRFEAKKGDRLRFAGQTRGYGTPTDLLLRLTDTAGKTLVEAEDTGLDEGALEYTFAADGAYLLQAEELLGRGGPQFTYRVEIEPYVPGFALTVDAEKFDVPLGGLAKAKVYAVRRGYTGPITFRPLVLDGREIATIEGTIPEGKNDGPITVRAAADLKPGMFSPAEMIGEGKLDKDGKNVVLATVLTTTALKPLFGGLANPPAGLAERVALSVGPPVKQFFEIEMPSKSVTLPQLVGKTTLAAKIKKIGKFDDVVTLTLDGLPAGFSAKPAKVEKGKTDAAIEIVGPATATPVEHRLKLSATATFNDQPRTETVDDVVLRVAPPIETTIDGPPVLAAGTKAKLTVRIVRNAEKAPVSLRWRLPPGVTSAPQTEVAADKSEAIVEVSVDAKAPLGPTVAVLSATTTVGGRSVMLDTAVVPLRIVGAAATATAAAK